MGKSFLLEATERADGKVRFACDELPGFRLLLEKKTDREAYVDDIQSALGIFMPYFLKAQTAAHRIDVKPMKDDTGGRQGTDFKLVAKLAPC